MFRQRVYALIGVILIVLIILYGRFSDDDYFTEVYDRLEKKSPVANSTFLKSHDPHDHLLYTTKLKFFIGVFSSPNNLDKRNGVRNTWGNHTSLWNQGIALRFLIGRSKNERAENRLRSEQAEYDDIIRPDIEEGYYSIASKAAALAHFASQLDCDFVVKTDDDSYIWIDQIVNHVLERKLEGGAPFLWGNLARGTRPIRNKKSKWYISKGAYPDPVFPTYAFGSAYVYTINLAKDIANQSKLGKLLLFKFEDVGMGLWVKDYENRTSTKVALISAPVHIDGCDANHIVAHHQTPKAMKCMHRKEKKKCSNICCKVSEY